MKRKWLLVLVCTIPIFIFANVYQVYRYKTVKMEIGILEAEQQDLLENNKRILAGIGVLKSPGRIDKLAEEELGLRKTGNGKTIRIAVPGSQEAADE